MRAGDFEHAFTDSPLRGNKRLMQEEINTRFQNLAAWVYATLGDIPYTEACVKELEVAAFYAKQGVRTK